MPYWMGCWLGVGKGSSEWAVQHLTVQGDYSVEWGKEINIIRRFWRNARILTLQVLIVAL